MKLLSLKSIPFQKAYRRSVVITKQAWNKTYKNGHIQGRLTAPTVMKMQSAAIQRINSQKRVVSCQGLAQQIIQAVSLEQLFSLSTYFALATYFLMIALPNLQFTKKFMKSGSPIVLLTATYCFLLWIAQQQKQLDPVIELIRTIPQLPDVAKFAQFFATMTIVVLTWCNVLILDLFIARELYLDGLHSLIPTRHTVLLCCFVGPLGIFCHILTKYVCNLQTARRVVYARA